MATMIQIDRPALTDTDLGLTDWELARDSVILAQLDFEDTVAKHGRGVALAMFNRRVSHWSNQFTNRSLRRFAYVLGSRMDGVTHTFRISQAALIDHYERAHNRSDGEWPGRARPDRRTIYRWTQQLVQLGVVTINDGAKERAVAGESADYPGLQNIKHTYTVDFSRVAVDGEVQAHDFMTVAPDPENVPSIVPSDVPSIVPSIVPRTSSTTSSKDSSADSSATSSNPGDGDADQEILGDLFGVDPRSVNVDVVNRRIDEVAADLEVTTSDVIQAMLWAFGGDYGRELLATKPSPIGYGLTILPSVVLDWLKAE